jgi:hypothetical protein
MEKLFDDVRVIKRPGLGHLSLRSALELPGLLGLVQHNRRMTILIHAGRRRAL